jgi:transcriptional regulator with XRE-family HTH domain
LAERPWVRSPSYEAAIGAIIAAREAAQLSQRQLAERLGKPRSFVSKLETRERRLDIVEFVAVARALGLEPRELLGHVLAVLSGPIEF